MPGIDGEIDDHLLDLALIDLDRAEIRSEIDHQLNVLAQEALQIVCEVWAEAAGSSLGKVVKCNVYLRDINDFQAMNEVYGTYFQPPFPARTTIQAGALPAGIAVEIEVVART